MSSDRHINFKLMRDRILALSEASPEGGHSEKSVNVASDGGRDARGPSKKYWRSLEEFVDAPEFREFVEREFPQQAEEWNDPIERRTFLKIMGASLALAGLSGCVYQPPEKIVPYVKQPEEEVSGKALFFATAVTLGGIATPVLARATKAVPPRSKAIPIIPTTGTWTRIALERRLISLRRLRYWPSTIRIVLRHRHISEIPGRGRRSSVLCVKRSTGKTAMVDKKQSRARDCDF
jgi:MoCo/4Fe-4S cofactor protein with predicted Tat translocation signal